MNNHRLPQFHVDYLKHCHQGYKFISNLLGLDNKFTEPFSKTICWLSQNLLYVNSNRNMCRGKILLSDIAETVHSDDDGRMSEAFGGRRKYSGGNILVA